MVRTALELRQHISRVAPLQHGLSPYTTQVLSGDTLVAAYCRRLIQAPPPYTLEEVRYAAGDSRRWN